MFLTPFEILKQIFASQHEVRSLQCITMKLHADSSAPLFNHRIKTAPKSSKTCDPIGSQQFFERMTTRLLPKDLGWSTSHQKKSHLLAWPPLPTRGRGGLVVPSTGKKIGLGKNIRSTQKHTKKPISTSAHSAGGFFQLKITPKISQAIFISGHVEPSPLWILQRGQERVAKALMEGSIQNSTQPTCTQTYNERASLACKPDRKIKGAESCCLWNTATASFESCTRDCLPLDPHFKSSWPLGTGYYPRFAILWSWKDVASKHPSPNVHAPPSGEGRYKKCSPQILPSLKDMFPRWNKWGNSMVGHFLKKMIDQQGNEHAS